MPKRLELNKSAMRIRALIVEDEDIGRRLLCSLLSAAHGVEVIAEARSVPEARQKIIDLMPDLVFMDIELPGGNGIELLRELDTPPEVIFVTAHPQFALPAFDVQAIDYLIKPVRQARLLEAVQRAKRRIAGRRVADLALRVADAVVAMEKQCDSGAPAPPAGYPNQLTIRVRRRTFWLDVADIFWIQGASQYCRVHAKGGEYLLSRSLSSLECELDPARFFRVHRSAIVNASHVREIRSMGDGRHHIHLHGGQALPIGRSRRDTLTRLIEAIAGQARSSRVG